MFSSLYNEPILVRGHDDRLIDFSNASIYLHCTEASVNVDQFVIKTKNITHHLIITPLSTQWITARISTFKMYISESYLNRGYDLYGRCVPPRLWTYEPEVMYRFTIMGIQNPNATLLSFLMCYYWWLLNKTVVKIAGEWFAGTATLVKKIEPDLIFLKYFISVRDKGGEISFWALKKNWSLVHIDCNICGPERYMKHIT